MLYNLAGKRVHIDAKKELSDFQKRMHKEKLEPQDHKGHPFFSIEQRAMIRN